MPRTFVPLTERYWEYMRPEYMKPSKTATGPLDPNPPPLDHFAKLVGSGFVNHLNKARVDYYAWQKHRSVDLSQAGICLNAIRQHCWKFPDPDNDAQLILLELLLRLPMGLRQHYAGEKNVRAEAQRIEKEHIGMGDWVLSLHVLEQMLLDKLLFSHRLCLPCGDAPPIKLRPGEEPVEMPFGALV